MKHSLFFLWPVRPFPCGLIPVIALLSRWGGAMRALPTPPVTGHIYKNSVLLAVDSMTSKFTEILHTQSVAGLLPVIEQGRMVAVVGRDHFPGLISPNDF